MKKNIILWLAAILALVCMCGCTPNGVDHDLYPEKTYKVIVIDSCEYIYISRRPWGAEFSITHKGNCKYCIERAKQNEINSRTITNIAR